ncbi:TetR/AcrR family transcriptional regulator [Nocardiopsis sp. RSe5-2]|uniref:TetR/AcrR family transcriptional regulator n=1 Tax=Nocardiopsis endophytica TaxID=3018445 RepID=A0ABT4UDU6_9ACTN|nr:TetR/AcrR family transcriptional regulator [Nocardiopsis endophytica]MDA2815141.1 TetR/AcrR family transcriptional regulator [Nocardiopsis endophytica]
MAGTEPDERRTAIIHAVWQVIAESGMGAVSMRNVAAAAGVSVGRIQYWFRSKDELLRASLEAMVAGAGERHTAGTEGVDDREALWRLIAGPIPLAESSRAMVSVFYQYVGAGISHPGLAAMLAEAKEGAETEAARLLERIAPGIADPRQAARSMMATADGLTMRVLIGGLSAAEAEHALRTEVDRVAG